MCVPAEVGVLRVSDFNVHVRGGSKHLLWGCPCSLKSHASWIDTLKHALSERLRDVDAW